MINGHDYISMAIVVFIVRSKSLEHVPNIRCKSKRKYMSLSRFQELSRAIAVVDLTFNTTRIADFCIQTRK